MNNDKQSSLKYIGFKSFYKFVIRFFILGIICSPIILYLINNNIWKDINEKNLKDSILTLLISSALFSIIPFTIGGILIWIIINRQAKFSINKETPYTFFPSKNWKNNDKIWDKIISYSSVLSVAVTILSLPLLFFKDVPYYYNFPFFTGCLYMVLGATYKIYKLSNQVLRKDTLVIHLFLKYIVVILLAILSISVLAVIIHSQTINY